MNRTPIIKYEHFPMPLLVGLLFCVIFLFFGLDGDSEEWSAAVFCAIVSVIIPLLKIRSSLVVYDDYIEGKIGLFNTKTLYSPLKFVSSIYIEESFVGKILGYQTIIIRTQTGIHYFKYAKNGKEIQDIVLNKIIKNS